MQTQPCPYCGRGTAAREWVVTGEQTDYTAPILMFVFFGGCGLVALIVGFMAVVESFMTFQGSPGSAGFGILCFAFVAGLIWFTWRTGHKQNRAIRWICRTCGAQWD